jgi:hypothetical protein
MRSFTLLLGLTACLATASCDRLRNERLPSLHDLKSAVTPAPAKGADGPWELACDGLCEVHGKATTPTALCDDLVVKLRAASGSEVSCQPRASVDLHSQIGSAIAGATILDVEMTGVRSMRHAFLALQLGKSWQVARPLGTVRASDSIGVVGARAVDLPGLAPAAAEVRVRVPSANGTEEHLVACGADEEGGIRCPVALIVARQRESGDRMVMAAAGAGLGAVARGPSDWRVDVQLTAQGYVAKSVAGRAPEGLLGEHRWASR